MGSSHKSQEGQQEEGEQGYVDAGGNQAAMYSCRCRTDTLSRAGQPNRQSAEKWHQPGEKRTRKGDRTVRYTLAIFDLDGTILNTLEDLTDSMNAALEKSGYPKRTIEEVRRFVGNGIRKLIERAVPQGTKKEDVDQVHRDFTEYYKAHCADKTRPYDGILDLLATLKEKGCRTAVVSNKADYGVQKLCHQYFEGLFDLAVGEREGILRKPAPDSVNQVLRRLQVRREDAVYIGDSEVDIQTAENAGMDHIIVDWGFRKAEFLREQGAKVIVSRPGEIAEIIQSGENQLTNL